MRIRQYEVWIADLNPRMGSEPGKTRPVVVVQTNLLNQIPHPSTVICPITTQIIQNSEILRVHIEAGVAKLDQASDIMIDQVRAIDNWRLINKVGSLPDDIAKQIKESLMVLFDF